MKYLQVYEMYKSTNPIHRIDKEDIEDIVINLTDEFSQPIEPTFTNEKEIVLGSMQRSVILCQWIFEIPDDKIEHFNSLVYKFVIRFRGIYGENVYTNLIPLKIFNNSYYNGIIRIPESMVKDKPYSFSSNNFILTIMFYILISY